MKVITIESEACKALARKIDRIYNYVKGLEEKKAVPPPDPSEIWVGNREAAELLEVSQRTLQRLRSNGEITYSIRGGRAWYTLREIQRIMPGRVVAGKYHHEEDFLRAHREYHERRRAKKETK